MSVLRILEDVLQTHPAVAETAVVATPDERGGEVPKAKAFIVPRRIASPRELIAWVADQVAPFPRIHCVEFVDQLPEIRAARERTEFASSQPLAA
jgi:acyl-coenzyme A synthetase/AMP-(fatty) acid ligase